MVLCCCGVLVFIVVLVLVVGSGTYCLYAFLNACMNEFAIALGSAIGQGIRFCALGH